MIKSSKIAKISLLLMFVMLFSFVGPVVQNVAYANEYDEFVFMSNLDLSSVVSFASGGGGSSGGGGAGGSWTVFSLDEDKLWDKELAQPHIFSKDHINNGIMDLGSSKSNIFQKIVKVAWAASKVIATLEGTKTIHTVINGIATTVRMHLVDGNVVSLNAFTDYSSRIIGELVDFTYKRY